MKALKSPALRENVYPAVARFIYKLKYLATESLCLLTFHNALGKRGPRGECPVFHLESNSTQRSGELVRGGQSNHTLKLQALKHDTAKLLPPPPLPIARNFPKKMPIKTQDPGCTESGWGNIMPCSHLKEPWKVQVSLLPRVLKWVRMT